MAGEQLRVTEGKARGKRLTVDAELLIGRSAEGEGRLGDDPEISRRHARLSRAGDGTLMIEDLGSANGTFVNGAPLVAPRKLERGDQVRLGQTVLEVSTPLGAVPDSPPPEEAARPSRPATSPDEELIVTAGKARGRRFPLAAELVIGRAVSGVGRLDEDRELSRRHVRIARDSGGTLTLEDLGSANGTFVNGERVRGSRVLGLGDSVRIGATTLQLIRAGSQPAPEASAPSPPVYRAPADSPQHRPVAAVARAGSEAAVSELALGSVFAGCRIEAVIGHGDMGVVYQADELALQRRVALKVIRPEYSRQERFRERFRRESKIAAAIDHPNVIPIFDAGHEEGVLYITMRLVEGTDLRAQIQRGRLKPLRAARIVSQVGAALDAAHARGMLHRDVKPSNVLLGREDHVYLSDFGLAKRADGGGALTRHQTIIARAEYVAPEQILNQSVDARVDVYALGCLLFEALTGEAPFSRSGQGAGAMAHLESAPPSPAELCPDLPTEFDEVVRRAMAKDPADRYPSAGDLGQAALVAAGGLRRASAWTAVATGEAALSKGRDAPERAAAPHDPPLTERASAGHPDTLRWAVALAGLVLVAVGMVAALHGISTL